MDVAFAAVDEDLFEEAGALDEGQLCGPGEAD